MHVKLALNNDVRRVFGDVETFEGVVASVRDAFPHLVGDFQLKYMDDEEDLVTICSQRELNEAFGIAKDEGRKSLKMFVVAEAALAEPPTEPVATVAEPVDDPPVLQSEPSVESKPPVPESKEFASQTEADDAPRDEASEDSCLGLFAELRNFLSDEAVRAVLPDAILVLRALLEGAADDDTGDDEMEPLSLREAVLQTLDSFPVMGEHPLLQKKEVRDRLLALCDQGQHLVPMMLQFDPAMIEMMIGKMMTKMQFAPLMMMPMMAPFFHAAAGSPKTAADPEVDDAAEPADPATVVHGQVVCDGCGQSPIVGPRFKCTECADFDLCSACETNPDQTKFTGGTHDVRHAMLKIRKPLSGRGCGFPGAFGPHMRNRRGGRHGWRHHRFGGPSGRFGGHPHGHFHGPRHHGGGARFCKSWKESNKQRLRARPELDVTIPEGCTLASNAGTLQKTWRVKNVGDVAWPEGTTLVHCRGDRFGPFEAAVPVCEPGATVDVSIAVHVPTKPGHYAAKYRLKPPKTAAANGKQHAWKFGKPLLVRFVVVGEETVPEAAPVAVVASEPSEEVSPSPAVEDAAAPIIEEELKQPLVETAAVVKQPDEPKADEAVKYASQMELLRSMGFQNDDLNLWILNETEGNVHQSALRLVALHKA